MTVTFDDPGTEQELNALEDLATAMYRADFIFNRGATPRWGAIDESIRQQFRDLADTWIESRVA